MMIDKLYLMFVTIELLCNFNVNVPTVAGCRYRLEFNCNLNTFLLDGLPSKQLLNVPTVIG